MATVRGLGAGLAGAGLLALALTGCGGSSKSASPATSAPAATTTPASTSSPATTAATTTTVAATTTTVAATTTTNFGQGVVGDVLGAVGTTLTPPAAPTVKPYSPNCATLLDPGYSGECLVINAPSGTIAAIVETLSGSEEASTQERDLVYSKTPAGWSLALRRVLTTEGVQDELEESDIMRDGDPKAVFVVRAGNAEDANELDVVEASGHVTLYRQLHGGFASVPTSGGLLTDVPSAAPAQGYDQALISYTGGEWKLTSDQQVSATQAQSETSSPFTDPQGTQPTYVSAAG